MGLLSGLNPYMRRGVIGAASVFVLDVVMSLAMGSLPLSILLIFQLLLIGFLFGYISGIVKYKVTNSFFASARTRMILFYIIFILATIMPSFLFPYSMCCDCFGPACTVIHGFPFPALISGEVMNVYLPILSIILLIGTFGFFLNAALYYVIICTIIFISKFLWKNKKILIGAVSIMILLFIIKGLTNERVYNVEEGKNLEEGKIYRLAEANEEFDIGRYAIYENKVAYIYEGNVPYRYHLLLFNLDSRQKELVAQAGFVETNVLGFDKDKIIYINWHDNASSREQYDSQGYIHILDLNDNATKSYSIPEKYMSVSGVLNLDFKDKIIVWDDKLPIPINKTYKPEVYSFINTDTMDRTVINGSQDKESGVFTNGQKIVFNSYIYNESDASRTPTGSKIIIYDIVAGKSEIIGQGNNELATDLSGNKIVLERRSSNFDDYDMKGDSDIFIYDIDSKQYMQVTDNRKQQREGKLYGDYVTWTDYRHGNAEIYVKDLKNGKELRVTRNSKNDNSPQIFGNNIVWNRRSMFGKTQLLLYVIPGSA